ncbi:MAG TPA: hypothetical protein PK280_09245 [Planctomycetota bacterium]|nr:hypothetical protein [Planctomycetota bacterium]
MTGVAFLAAALLSWTTVPASCGEDSGAILVEVKEQLESQDNKIVLAGLGRLGELKPAGVKQLAGHIVRLMDSSSPEVKKEALRADKYLLAAKDRTTIRLGLGQLYRLGPAEIKEVAPTVIGLMEHTDIDVQKTAIAAGKLLQADKDVAPVIVRLMDHEDTEVQREAIDAIKNLNAVTEMVAPALLAKAGDAGYVLRGRAIIALPFAGVSYEAAKPVLLKAVQDRTTQETAIVALAKYQDKAKDVVPDVLDAVIAQRKDAFAEPPSKLQDLVKALGPEVSPALEKIYDRSDNGMKQMIAEVIAVNGPWASPVLVKFVKGCRQNAVNKMRIDPVLEKLGPQAAEAVPALLPIFEEDFNHKDFRQRERMLAVEVASRIGAPALEILKKALADKDSTIVWAAAVQLRKCAPQEIGLPAGGLKQALRDPAVIALAGGLDAATFDQRRTAIRQLADKASASPEAVAALGYALLDEDMATGQMAAEELKRLKAGAKPAYDHLMRAYQYGNQPLQMLAMEILPFVAPNSAEVMDKIVKRLDDKSDAVRRRAAAALGDFGETARPVMEERLRGTKDTVMAIGLVEGLRKIGPKVVPALASRLEVRDNPVNSEIIRTLATMAKTSPEAMAALKKAAGSADPAVKAEAARAVAQIEAGR